VRTASPTNQLTLPFFDIQTMPKQKKQPKPAGRSQDSEGRFVVEVQIPTPEVFRETEKRRDESYAKRLRQVEEENLRLKAKLAQYE